MNTIHAQRLSEELDHIRSIGCELGDHLASHLGIAELLSLPTDTAELAELIAGPFRTAFLDALVDPDDNWYEWEDDLLPGLGIRGPIARNRNFWIGLYLAIETHVLAGADDVDTLPDGTIDVVPDRANGCSYRLPARGAGQSDGDARIGQIYLSTRSLPGAYATGVAQAVADLQRAVADGFDDRCLT